MKLPIYMDYSATTPVDQRVADKMIPYLTEKFGNPASRSHAFGWEADEAVELARAQVAALVNADPKKSSGLPVRPNRTILPSRVRRIFIRVKASTLSRCVSRQGGDRHRARAGARRV